MSISGTMWKNFPFLRTVHGSWAIMQRKLLKNKIEMRKKCLLNLAPRLFRPTTVFTLLQREFLFQIFDDDDHWLFMAQGHFSDFCFLKSTLTLI